jgi:hypothetical protein
VQVSVVAGVESGHLACAGETGGVAVPRPLTHPRQRQAAAANAAEGIAGHAARLPPGAGRRLVASQRFSVAVSDHVGAALSYGVSR